MAAQFGPGIAVAADKIEVEAGDSEPDTVLGVYGNGLGVKYGRITGLGIFGYGYDQFRLIKVALRKCPDFRNIGGLLVKNGKQVAVRVPGKIETQPFIGQGRFRSCPGGTVVPRHQAVAVDP